MGPHCAPRGARPHAERGQDGPVTPNPARPAPVLVLLPTVLQLAVAAARPDLPQFAGKGFGARLALYPAMMLLVPAAWWLRERFGPGGRADAGASAPRSDPPWAGFAVLMTPFLVDVTGNSLDL